MTILGRQQITNDDFRKVTNNKFFNTSDNSFLFLFFLVPTTQISSKWTYKFLEMNTDRSLSNTLYYIYSLLALLFYVFLKFRRYYGTLETQRGPSYVIRKRSFSQTLSTAAIRSSHKRY